MKNKISITSFLILSLNLFSMFSYAQNFQWVNHQSLNLQSNPEITSFVSETDIQGNSLLASLNLFKISYGGYFGDVSLKKFNSSGQLLFTKLLYGKLIVEGLQTDLIGNIYLSGSFMDTLRIDSVNYILNTGSGFNTNCFLIKLTQNGDFVWKKNIDVVYPSASKLDAIKIKDNNLFAGLLNFNEGYIKKFDLNGTELMSITQSPVRSISGIDVDGLGNIYSGGACTNGDINFAGHIASTSFGYNVYLVKYNSSGNYLWSRFVEDITFSSIDIACDHSGNLFASGNLWGSFMFGTIQTQGRQWVYDFFLTKLDANGSFLWVKEVPNTPTITGDAGKAKVNALSVDLDNNVCFAGFLRGSVNWGNNVITTSLGYTDILFLKYDQSGNILNGKRAGGMGSNRADDISLDNEGNIFLSGNFSSTAIFDTITAAGNGNVNSFLAKILSPQLIGNINVKLIIEGFYNLPSDNMRINDTVRIYLRNSSSPYLIVDSSKSLIDPLKLTGSFLIVHAPAGNYYIQIKHRNSLETWNASAINYIQGEKINYDFTLSAAQAFGNNMLQVNNSPVRFAIYSGDVNQDGIVDFSDASLIDNDTYNFASGYLNTDLTGDNFVDLFDYALADNNAFNFISKIVP
ncbi:MAG: hypothetical protein ABI840_10380 [bacterium]